MAWLSIPGNSSPGGASRSSSWTWPCWFTPVPVTRPPSTTTSMASTRPPSMRKRMGSKVAASKMTSWKTGMGGPISLVARMTGRSPSWSSTTVFTVSPMVWPWYETAYV